MLGAIVLQTPIHLRAYARLTVIPKYENIKVKARLKSKVSLTGHELIIGSAKVSRIEGQSSHRERKSKAISARRSSNGKCHTYRNMVRN